MTKKISTLLLQVAMVATIVAVPVAAQGAVVAQQIDLALVKTASVTEVLPGDPFTYTMTVSNNGLSAANDVVIRDTLPPGITFVGGPGCTAVGGAVECAIGFLDGITGAPANQATVTIDVVANHTTAGACVNTAAAGFVDPTLEDNDGGNNDEIAAATVDCKLLGSIGDFIWNDANNNGLQDAGELGIGGVTVTLTGGPGGTVVSAGDGLYALFTGLPAGTYTVTVDPATAPAGMVLTTPGTVTVTLVAGQVYLDADFGFYTPPPPPPTQIDLELTKIVSNAVVAIGDQVIWTIGVTNKGPAGATGVTVSDLLPTGATYVSDNSGGAFSSATGVWTIGSLAAGASASLEITTTIDTAGIKVNRAQVATANETDIDSTPGNCPALPAALGEDDCADAEVGTVLQATSTTTPAATTLVRTGPSEQTRRVGFVGLASLLLGVAMVLAARNTETAPGTRRRRSSRR